MYLISGNLYKKYRAPIYPNYISFGAPGVKFGRFDTLLVRDMDVSSVAKRLKTRHVGYGIRISYRSLLNLYGSSLVIVKLGNYMIGEMDSVTTSFGLEGFGYMAT